MPHQPFPSSPCQESKSCHHSPSPCGHAQQKLRRQGQKLVDLPPTFHMSPLPSPLRSVTQYTRRVHIATKIWCHSHICPLWKKYTTPPVNFPPLSYPRPLYSHPSTGVCKKSGTRHSTLHPDCSKKGWFPSLPTPRGAPTLHYFSTVSLYPFLAPVLPVPFSTPTPQIYPPVPQHPPYNATPPHVPTAVTECQLTKHSIHPPHPVSSPHTTGKNGHLPQGLAT